MRYAVHVDDDAAEEILRAATYIAIDCQAPINAARWLDRLWELIDTLERWPERGPIDPAQTRATGVDTHKLNFGRYLIFYQIDHDQRQVKVMGFMHGSTRKDA